jgi:two-component system NtrC family sensor kinase
MTERAQTERIEELYRLAALGRLLAGLAHEINTPLSSLLSNNEMLQRSLVALEALPLPPGVTQTLRTMRGLNEVDKVACERLAALVRGAKMLSRGDTTELYRADVNALVRDGLTLVNHMFKPRIAVETDLGDIPPLVCYPHLLGQVFVNLLVNAAQAIEGEGKVVIRTRREGDKAHISISDTGRGIPSEHRERVFESGFTTKPPGIGTGLGLALSKEIVRQHGGSIDFESRPGQGTTFHIRIPVLL